MVAKAVFHIWETRIPNEAVEGPVEPASVGHASMQLPGGQYLSVRPECPFSVNPLTVFFPVRARNSSYSDDVLYEGRDPDRSVSVPLSERELENLSQGAASQVSDMQSGHSRYQLLPEVGYLSFAKKLAKSSFLQAFSRNPFSGESTTTADHEAVTRGIESVTATHCSLSLADLLNKAGVTVEVSRFPWRITPSELGNQLERMEDRTPN